MVTRDLLPELRAAAGEYPVVTLVGPRQSGKTTLAQRAFPAKPYRSLEDPDVRAWAQQDPRGFLAGLQGGGILDEIQRTPELLSYLQTHVDRQRGSGQFILTGSHQPEVHHAVAQSLAGRTAMLTLLPFSLRELRHYRKRWTAFELVVCGTFPGVHENRLDPARFFNSYVQTYLERDVRALIHLKDLRRFQQFMTLLAGRVGQLLNYSSLANDLGVSANTIKDWIGVLSASYVIFELPPYFENINKRVIKAPKVYFTDAGLAAHLAGLRTLGQVERDPLRGGLYENWVIAEVLKSQTNRGLKPELFFYRDSHGNEVDLLVRHAGKLRPVEIKSAATFHSDFHVGLARFRETLGAHVHPGFIIYNGSESARFKGARVFNPLRHDHLDELITD
jgi:predicted AAA+ superfamily ATPase